MKKVVFTTTIPVEVVIAAKLQPVDMNNIFVSSNNSKSLVEFAEIDGFPRSSCAWIKGLYSTVAQDPPLLDYKDITLFVAVTEGDCSNAGVLAQIVSSKFNIPSHLFSFHPSQSLMKMRAEIERFAQSLGTTLADTVTVWKELKAVREDLRRLDEMSYENNVITGQENHLWLVSASDFNGDYKLFHQELKLFLSQAENRKPFEQKVRIGYLGVPPIFDIYDFIEKHNGRVIFNEIQRQFAMVESTADIAEQYCNYSYPYSAEYRFRKAIVEMKKRNITAVIHYVQSFCHRHIEDILLRKIMAEEMPGVPLLTLEGDKPQSELDGRIRTRIEAFLETAERG
ncbi:2-hydroxyacyl-CoA dehydratase [bacterium]|nr:2-hydroxyacyl-CoA dehydratase [bacterium]